jgi:HAD superfamily hydrolase (TIGR01509 family)
VYSQPPDPAFVFDLDGTLVDSVYQHVFAWQRALADLDVSVPVWRVHRRIGMGSDLLAAAVLRESGHRLTDEERDTLTDLHGRYYAELSSSVRPLPGALALLDRLDELGLRWGIATSGAAEETAPVLAMLGVESGCPIVTGDDVPFAKPDPHLFLAGAEAIGVDPAVAVVVGDSTWDMLAARRAGAVGVGLLTGGFSAAELVEGHAFRTYADPGDLLVHLDELGVRVGEG